MSATTPSRPPTSGRIGTCECAFNVWSNPWPGRPRGCMGCGLLCPDDLPCQHLHFHAGTELCSDCETPPDDSKGYRERRLAQVRPPGLVIGALSRCSALRPADLSDPGSPQRPCGYVTTFRLGGQAWCLRCWWTTKAGLGLASELKAVVQP